MLTTWLVAQSSCIMMWTPACILVFYSHTRPAYRELVCQAPCSMELLDGVKHFTKEIAMRPGTIVIMDDMQAIHVCLVSAWFMCKSDHYDASLMYLVHNVSDKDHQPQSQVPGVPLGQASVPRQQWPPDSCLPGRHGHAGPQLCDDWLQPDNAQVISHVQHPVPK